MDENKFQKPYEIFPSGRANSDLTVVVGLDLDVEVLPLVADAVHDRLLDFGLSREA